MLSRQLSRAHWLVWPHKKFSTTHLHWSLLICCRYEKLAEQEEMNAQQQRRRLFAELQTERDKMTTQWDQQKREMEQLQAASQVGWGSYSLYILHCLQWNPLAKILGRNALRGTH